MNEERERKRKRAREGGGSRKKEGGEFVYKGQKSPLPSSSLFFSSSLSFLFSGQEMMRLLFLSSRVRMRERESNGPTMKERKGEKTSHGRSERERERQERRVGIVVPKLGHEPVDFN